MAKSKKQAKAPEKEESHEEWKAKFDREANKRLAWGAYANYMRSQNSKKDDRMLIG